MLKRQNNACIFVHINKELLLAIKRWKPLTQWKQLIICLTRAYPLFVGNAGSRNIIKLSFVTQQEKAAAFAREWR
jgi:hypothetical protein